MENKRYLFAYKKPLQNISEGAFYVATPHLHLLQKNSNKKQYSVNKHLNPKLTLNYNYIRGTI
jgi:hypothetical protein